MTCHRLVHCRPADLVEQVARRPNVQPNLQGQVAPHWFPRAVPKGGAMISWRQRGPGGGGLLTCCLEVEPAATGVLAHLTAVPVSGRTWPLPGLLSMILLKAWTAHLLAGVASAVEADPATRESGQPTER
jgi:hypothetical protein